MVSKLKGAEGKQGCEARGEMELVSFRLLMSCFWRQTWGSGILINDSRALSEGGGKREGRKESNNVSPVQPGPPRDDEQHTSDLPHCRGKEGSCTIDSSPLLVQGTPGNPTALPGKEQVRHSWRGEEQPQCSKCAKQG